LLAESVNDMLCCAKQFLESIDQPGGGPASMFVPSTLGQRSLRKLAVRPIIHGESSRMEGFAMKESNRRQNGMRT
jgi:hypothetical protein